MSYSVSLPKSNIKEATKKAGLKKKLFKNKRASFNSDHLLVDFFCHITYMAALATSGLPRNILFEYASKLRFSSSQYVKEIQYIAKKLNYDYSEACRLVGEKSKEADVKSLLLRLSSAMASGENEVEFLSREAYVLGEKYADDYERRVESLKRWTDTFVALILSASLIVVINVVSMLIFPANPVTIAGLTWLMLMATASGVWIMHRATPKEIKTHSLPHTAKSLELCQSLFKYIACPLGFVITIGSVIFKLDLGIAMLLLSIVLTPIGFLAYRNDRKIDRYDSDISALMRSLGGVAKAIGSTITEALGRIDMGSIGSLKQNAMALLQSLKFGIDPQLCWMKFIEETGSEHVNRTTRIFWDGNAIGGDPREVGNQSSMFSMKVALLRGKRQMVASGFSYLCLVMHGALALLLVGIYNVLYGFSRAMEATSDVSKEGMGALMQLPTFAFFADGGSQLQTLNLMVTAMLIMLTVANPVAVKVVEGGNNLKTLFYFGITLFLSAMCLLVVPGMVKGVFGTVGAFK